jgi:hypothetical protein
MAGGKPGQSPNHDLRQPVYLIDAAVTMIEKIVDQIKGLLSILLKPRIDFCPYSY